MADSMYKGRVHVYLDSSTRQQAYVALPGGNFLCIGTREDVDKAGIAEVGDMVISAVQVSRYLAIERGRGERLH